MRRDTDDRSKPVVKTTGKERFQQQVPPGAREQGAETEESKNCQQQKHLGARKKELPAAKTPQSKEERNRDRREQEDPGTETPGSFPLQRTQGERAHSNRGVPELRREEQGPTEARPQTNRSLRKSPPRLGPQQREPDQQAVTEEPGMPCKDGMKRLVGIKRLEKLDEASRRKRVAGTD